MIIQDFILYIILGGTTLHHAFDFKFGTDHNPLGNKKRDELRNTFKDLEIIIIDEFSMVSADMVYRLSLRLCEIFISEMPFGGKVVYFVGDTLQLKPVQARSSFACPSCPKFVPLYSSDSLWEKFKVIVLKTNHRQGSGTDWCQILNRARVGELTDEDKEILETRRIKHHPHVDFGNAWHVFYPNKEVKAHNMKKLNELPGQIARIGAKTNYPKGYTPVIKEWGTIDDTQFEKILEIKKGSRVVLVFNVAVSDSLVNGEVGTVLDIIKEKDDFKAIMVQFDNPEAGQNHCKSNAAFMKRHKIATGTPIFRSTLEYCIKLKRGRKRHGCTGRITQFPLKLAYSFTAHKLQGVTAPKDTPFVCHGHPKLQTGMGYVMLSRCPQLENLYIDDNFDLEKIKPNEAAAMENERMNFESIVSQFQDQKFDLYMVNIRSLPKNLSALHDDIYASHSDIIATVETHLEPAFPTTNMTFPSKVFVDASIGKGKGCGLFMPENSDHTCVKIIRDTYQMIMIPFLDQFHLIIAYLSSDCTYHNVVEDLKSMDPDFEVTFLIGDFNFDPFKDPPNALSRFLESENFNQLITQPTHDKGRTIDHFYSPDWLTETLEIQVVYPFFTDHAAICVKFKE